MTPSSVWGERRMVLLQAHEPSLCRFITLGKAVPVTWRDGRVEWMYCNNLSGELRTTQTFGVARCAVALMARWDVPRVLYLYDGQYYSVTRDQIIAECRPWAMTYRPRYFNVPRALWKQVAEGQVCIPRTNDRLVLEWDVPDSAWTTYAPQDAIAQQLSLI